MGWNRCSVVETSEWDADGLSHRSCSEGEGVSVLDGLAAEFMRRPFACANLLCGGDPLISITKVSVSICSNQQQEILHWLGTRSLHCEGSVAGENVDLPTRYCGRQNPSMTG